MDKKNTEFQHLVIFKNSFEDNKTIQIQLIIIYQTSTCNTDFCYRQIGNQIIKQCTMVKFP